MSEISHILSIIIYIEIYCRHNGLLTTENADYAETIIQRRLPEPTNTTVNTATLL